MRRVERGTVVEIWRDESERAGRVDGDREGGAMAGIRSRANVMQVVTRDLTIPVASLSARQFGGSRVPDIVNRGSVACTGKQGWPFPLADDLVPGTDYSLESGETLMAQGSGHWHAADADGTYAIALAAPYGAGWDSPITLGKYAGFCASHPLKQFLVLNPRYRREAFGPVLAAVRRRTGRAPGQPTGKALSDHWYAVAWSATRLLSDEPSTIVGNQVYCRMASAWASPADAGRVPCWRVGRGNGQLTTVLDERVDGGGSFELGNMWTEDNPIGLSLVNCGAFLSAMLTHPVHYDAVGGRGLHRHVRRLGG